jgi:hypothetical protein
MATAGQRDCVRHPLADDLGDRASLCVGVPEVARYGIAHVADVLDAQRVVEPQPVPGVLELLRCSLGTDDRARRVRWGGEGEQEGERENREEREPEPDKPQEEEALPASSHSSTLFSRSDPDVLETVTQSVKADAQRRQADPGEQHEPRVEELVPRLGQHRPPRGRRGLHTEAQKAEARFQQHHEGGVHREVDDEQGPQLRDDVHDGDARGAGADRARRLDVQHLAQPERLAVEHPRGVGPREAGQRDDQHHGGRPEGGDDRHGDQETGQHHERLGYAHQDELHHPAHKPGRHAHQRGQDQCQEIRDHGHQDRDSCAVNQP